MVLAALFFVPLQRVNVSDILPVEAVAVYMDGERVVLELDTGEKGSGKSVGEAIEDLKRSTPRIIYPDTARYLLVTQNAESYVDALRPYLKNKVQVHSCDARDRVAEIAAYLSARGRLPKLEDWKK